MAFALPFGAGYMSCSTMSRRSRPRAARSSSSGPIAGAPSGGLDHGAPLNGLVETDALVAGLRGDPWIHLLEMDIADPIGVPADDVAVVTGAVLDVTCIEAQRDELRIGVIEELVDEPLGVDVGVDVRMEAEANIELLRNQLPEL